MNKQFWQQKVQQLETEIQDAKDARNIAENQSNRDPNNKRAGQEYDRLGSKIDDLQEELSEALRQLMHYNDPT